jgi:hypothetical protein
MGRLSKFIVAILCLQLLFLCGCGGGGGGGDSGGSSGTSKNPPASGAQSSDPSAFITSNGTVNNHRLHPGSPIPDEETRMLVINQTGHSQDIVDQCVAYCDEQMQQAINPRYGVNARVYSAAQDDGVSLVVYIQERGPYNVADGRLINSYPDGRIGYTAWNDGTILVTPARVDHLLEDLLDPVLLIGQAFEARDYSPLTHLEESHNGYWWLCDFVLQPGMLTWDGRAGFQDYLGTTNR